MKHSISILLTAMLAALVGCGKEPDQSSQGNNGTSTEGMTIAGTPVTDYRIIYNLNEEDNASYQAALELRDAAKKGQGKIIKVSNVTAVSESDCEIIVGQCGRDACNAYYSQKHDTFDWTIKVVGKKVLVAGGSSWGLKAAANTLRDKYLSVGESIPADFELSGTCRRTMIFDRPGQTDLRIMSYNIWNYEKEEIPAAFYKDGVLLYDPRNSNRSKDFAAVFKCVSPDVFGLQEYASEMETYLMPLITSQYKKVATSSSQWNWTPIFYNSANLSLKTADYLLYDAPWSNSNSKSYTIAVFTHKATGKDIIVLNTHLWWQKESVTAGSDQARLDQVKLILAKVDEYVKTYDAPVFVMGDMNSNLSTEPMKAFVTAGYHSSAQDATVKKDGSMGYHSCSTSGFSPETASQLENKNGTTAIDHIWFYNTENKAVVGYYTIIHTSFTYPMSDHAPRYVDATVGYLF